MGNKDCFSGKESGFILPKPGSLGGTKFRNNELICSTEEKFEAG